MYLHIKILGPDEINICCDTMLHQKNSILIEYLYLCMYSLFSSFYFILFWEVGLKRCCGDKDLCCCEHTFYVVIAVRIQETLHTKKGRKSFDTSLHIQLHCLHYSVALHFGHVLKKTMWNSNCYP